MIIDTTKTRYKAKKENTKLTNHMQTKNENTNEQRLCVGTNVRGARDRRRRRGWPKVRMVPTTTKTTGPPVQRRPNSRDKMLTHPAKHRPRMWHSFHCALISMRLLSQIASQTNIEATGSIDRSIVRRLRISKYPKSKPSHPASQLLNSHLPPCCCCFSLASN